MDFLSLRQKVFDLCKKEGVLFNFYTTIVDGYNVETSEPITVLSNYKLYGFWLPPGATMYIPGAGTMIETDKYKIVAEAISGPCPKHDDYVLVNSEKYTVSKSKQVDPVLKGPIVYVMELEN